MDFTVNMIDSSRLASHAVTSMGVTYTSHVTGAQLQQQVVQEQHHQQQTDRSPILNASQVQRLTLQFQQQHQLEPQHLQQQLQVAATSSQQQAQQAAVVAQQQLHAHHHHPHHQQHSDDTLTSAELKGQELSKDEVQAAEFKPSLRESVVSTSLDGRLEKALEMEPIVKLELRGYHPGLTPESVERSKDTIVQLHFNSISDMLQYLYSRGVSSQPIEALNFASSEIVRNLNPDFVKNHFLFVQSSQDGPVRVSTNECSNSSASSPTQANASPAANNFPTIASNAIQLPVGGGKIVVKQERRRGELPPGTIIHRMPPSEAHSHPVFVCWICGLDLQKSLQFEEHMMDQHSVDKPYRCEECGVNFKRKAHLDRHRRIHLPTRPFQCGICGKGFTRNEHVRRHAFTHSGKKIPMYVINDVQGAKSLRKAKLVNKRKKTKVALSCEGEYCAKDLSAVGENSTSSCSPQLVDSEWLSRGIEENNAGTSKQASEASSDNAQQLILGPSVDDNSIMIALYPEGINQDWEEGSFPELRFFSDSGISESPLKGVFSTVKSGSCLADGPGKLAPSQALPGTIKTPVKAAKSLASCNGINASALCDELVGASSAVQSHGCSDRLSDALDKGILWSNSSVSMFSVNKARQQQYRKDASNVSHQKASDIASPVLKKRKVVQAAGELSTGSGEPLQQRSQSFCAVPDLSASHMPLTGGMSTLLLQTTDSNGRVVTINPSTIVTQSSNATAANNSVLMAAHQPSVSPPSVVASSGNTAVALQVSGGTIVAPAHQITGNAPVGVVSVTPVPQQPQILQGGATVAQLHSVSSEVSPAVGKMTTSKRGRAVNSNSEQNRPFTCSACNKAFVRNEHLRRHLLTHSGERPYGCDTCGKQFSRREHLSKHSRSHAKSDAASCEQPSSSVVSSSTTAIQQQTSNSLPTTLQHHNSLQVVGSSQPAGSVVVATNGTVTNALQAQQHVAVSAGAGTVVSAAALSGNTVLATPGTILSSATVAVPASAGSHQPNVVAAHSLAASSYGAPAHGHASNTAIIPMFSLVEVLQ